MPSPAADAPAAEFEAGLPLCDWTRSQMKRERDLMLRIKLDPRFECRKCHRWASESKWLCEPTPLCDVT